MGQSRIDFQAILETFTDNVYFQPPDNLQLEYPCIVYKREYVTTTFANDKPYIHKKRYMVTVIDRDPDSEIPDQVASLPLSAFNRSFTTESLYHDIYRVYF